ncbi:hypothetical protein GCM10009832_11380 [Dietzia kunjamensis subsp. schimae]
MPGQAPTKLHALWGTTPLTSKQTSPEYHLSARNQFSVVAASDVHTVLMNNFTTMDSFPTGVSEKLAYYVYALVDPRTEQIFYVGKGHGERIFAHARAAAIKQDEGMNVKLDRIRDITKSGRSVGVYVIRHGIPSEKLAYEIEAAVIDTMKLANILSDDDAAEPLTNIVSGHRSAQVGLMDLPTLVSEYTAPRAPDITEPSLLIRISRLWTPTISEIDGGQGLYEATRQWWKLGERRGKARYAFAVSNGVVRAVYEIDQDSWEGGKHHKREEECRIVSAAEAERWRFSGRSASSMASFVGTDVSGYFTAGSQNPIRYVNC